eukprot:gb/GECG01001844.1/.p1 GENE.gb/GECG01001844.1/~~gb/GECG01001844.1/.p1  ORF type:complete len:378 (+),score=54.27 gb/GECG01001844.1/:1-1134(+)
MGQRQWYLVGATAGGSILVCCLWWWRKHRRSQKNEEDEDNSRSMNQLREELRKWKSLREEERKGRIRAEKQLQDKTTKEQVAQGYSMRPIGIFRTPFRDRRGTPRQGAFCPGVEGQLILHPSIGPTAVENLEDFSHVWVFFAFHKNTGNRSTKDTHQGFNFKAKIAAPGLAGKTTGALATRTPHRPNNIGLSLVKLDYIEERELSEEDIQLGLYTPSLENSPQEKKYRRRSRRTVLHFSALDLVDGTPVFDIKPFVPLYDSPPEHECRVPSWIATTAHERLGVVIPEDVVERATALHTARAKAKWCCHSSSGKMIEALKQILSLDIRSVHQGRAIGNGESPSKHESDTCPFEVWYDNLHITWRPGTLDNFLHVLDVS